MMWLAGTGVARRLVRFLEQPLDELDAVRDRLPRAAGLLDVERVQRRSARRRRGFSCSIRPLIWLVSQPRPTTSTEAKFGVPRVAAERAAQHLQRLAVAVGRAAGAVRQRDDAVDVREALERVAGWMSRRKWSAIARATVAEQFTEVRMPM